MVAGQIEIKRFGLVDENREPKNRRLPWFIPKKIQAFSPWSSESENHRNYAANHIDPEGSQRSSMIDVL
jgi:hypothetical protein